MDQATAAGRWNEVLAVALPDAQAGSAAMKRPIARQLEQMKQMTGDAPMTVKNEVMAVTLAGGEAIVRVRGVATMTKAGVPRRYEGSNRDVWVLRDGVWMLKDSTIISQQEVIAELDQAAAKQVAVAIAARAVSLRTAEAGGPVDDLAAFGTAVGNARLVALGEATHGTREIFQMKHRLLEYLVKEKGFTVFAIEANWPESQAADRYIKTGEGNPRQALKDMYFWTWQTDEVLAMLEWMREFNKAPGKHPILSFTSFDMQTYRVALEKVLEFVRKHSPNDVAEVEGNYAPLRQLNERAMGEQRFDVASSRAEANIRLLESRREVLLKATSEQAFNDAVQMARIVVQAAKVRAPAAGPSYRDEMMAKNIEWLADVVYPDEKIVLWAHNGHVSTSASEDYRFKPMGHWLRQRFGTAIYVTGFAIHTGTVRAVGSGGKTGLGTHEVPASKPGSGSGILSATGKPLFFLDLKFGSERALGAWLAGRHSFRECGAIWNTDDAASNTIAYSPAAAFDSLIFIEKAQAARALQ
jgi:erythromycin esterase